MLHWNNGRIWTGLCFLLGLCAGCGPSAAPRDPATPAAPTNTFTVMTYNLNLYSLEDRDGHGQKDIPKPAEEREALIELIRINRPDVLAVQEIGQPSILEEFRFALQKAGLEYPHLEYLQRGRTELNMAVLSRFPIVSRQSHLDDKYTIGEAVVPVSRGFIDVDLEVNPNYRFRLMTAHLKSKVFHSLGQTEMRRNEARLLGNHIRRALKENPEINLLVVGDMNDQPNSAALREITGSREQLLQDLRPADPEGDAWTHFDSAQDIYSRIDYMLASRGMAAEVFWEGTVAVRSSLTRQASDHRPLMATFVAQEAPLPPLEKKTPKARKAKPATDNSDLPQDEGDPPE